MNPTEELSLEEKRLQLRQQMWAQRQQLAEKLHPPPRTDVYPRSMTMRFLTKQGGLRAALALATAFLGTKRFKSLSTLFLVSRMVSSSMKKSRRPTTSDE